MILRQPWVSRIRERVTHLCDEKHQILLEVIKFPEPVISLAVEPKTKQDMDKLGYSLEKLAQEDPSFRVKIG